MNSLFTYLSVITLSLYENNSWSSHVYLLFTSCSYNLIISTSL